MHHPVEYLSGLLTSVRDDKDRTAVYLAECRTLGIEVTCPTSTSRWRTSPRRRGERRVIVFGLAAVRNVGESLVERIVAERDANGPFETVYDFVRRVDPLVLNKRTMESLIKGGAFDSFGVPPQGAVPRGRGARRAHPRAPARARRGDRHALRAAAEEKGEVRAPGRHRDRDPDQEFSKHERLRFEKEMLGLYVSDHPLLGAAGMLRAAHRPHDRRVEGARRAARARAAIVRVGGVVTDVQRRFSKRGEEWARFTLEDLGGAIEVLCFAKPFHDFGALSRPTRSSS